MTSQGADSQRNFPSQLPNVALPHGNPNQKALSSSYSPTSDATFPLDVEICDYYQAHPLQGIRPADVFEFLETAVSRSYVNGIKELMKVAEAKGYFADLQFFRCNDRSKIPPVAVTFSKEGADGELSYGIPNVAAILDSPEERLRGDNSPSGKKLVRAVDGTAANEESGAFGGNLRFEEYSAPVRVLLSESSDSELHRPFDVAAQYSHSVRDEALRRMKVAFTDSNQFSFLKDCVVHPEITQLLSRYTPMFGARETAQVQSAQFSPDGILQLTIGNPAETSGEPIVLDVKVMFTPAAQCSAILR